MTGDLLDARLVVDRGSFRLDAHLRIAAGEVLALLGPNGAGKTTALRALAGLEPLTAGHVTLGERVLDRPDARVWTPPERRPIGVVFQDYLLFPHLSALDNIAFGPRRHGVDRAPGPGGRGATGWPGWAWPSSAGASHASSPAVRRSGWRWPGRWPPTRNCCCSTSRWPRWTRVPGWTPGSSCSATWPRTPARRCWSPTTRSTRWCSPTGLVVIEHGAVVQEGDAAAVTARPRTDYVARLVGLNLYRGNAADGGVRVAEGLTLAVTDRVGRRGVRRVPAVGRGDLQRNARRAARATCGRRPSAASSGTATTSGWCCTARSRRRPTSRRRRPPSSA